jgi:hypothetical protein
MCHVSQVQVMIKSLFQSHTISYLKCRSIKRSMVVLIWSNNEFSFIAIGDLRYTNLSLTVWVTCRSLLEWTCHVLPHINYGNLLAVVRCSLVSFQINFSVIDRIKEANKKSSIVHLVFSTRRNCSRKLSDFFLCWQHALLTVFFVGIASRHRFLAMRQQSRLGRNI